MRIGRYLLLWIAASCTTDASDSLFTTQDSAGIRIVLSRSPAWSESTVWRVDSVPTRSIGIQDGDPRYTLDRVFWPRRLRDGRIVVPNTRSGIIKVYSSTGDYVTEFGGEGDGPGEFRYMAYIDTDAADTLRVYDALQQRITVFTADGRVVRTVPIEQTGFYYGVLLGWFADGSFGLTKNIGGGIDPNLGDQRDSFALEWHRLDGAVATERGIGVGIRRFSTSDRGTRVHPFTPRFMAAATDEVVAVGGGYEADIRFLDAQGQLTKILRWVTPDPNLTDRDYGTFVRRMRDQFPPERLPGYLRALAEGPEMRRLPVYAALLWDAVGNLWVRQYHWESDSNWIGRGYIGNTGPGDWWIFDPQGRWLGTVVMPDDLDVSEIGADYVLGVHRDALDVERIQVHRLIR